jgi:hypothetical protein
MPMPVDLVGALVGWVVSLTANAGIRLVRSSPDERASSKAMGLDYRPGGRADRSVRSRGAAPGAAECFSAPPRLGLDAST